MEFSLTQEQEAIVESVKHICAGFPDSYWLERDTDGVFPHDFHRAMADGGFLGITMPPEFGGAGLGVTEAALMMNAVSSSGGGFAAASTIHINLFGPHPIVVFGTDEQKARWLPALITGKDRTCFGVTEPDAGLDTTSLTTKAVRTNEGYVLSGRKMWTTMAQRATKMLIVARTTPKDQVKRPTDGISLFYVDFDRERIHATPIPKMGRKAIESNAVFIDDLHVPADALVGEEGRGFYYLLEGLNPERVLIGAEAVGLGRAALKKAAAYAKERVVFGRPIGQNQGVAHPLARVWAELEAANLMAFKAAALYDAGRECAPEANAAKYLGGEAGFRACEAAVMAHGGMGYAKEFDVERYFREAMIPRIAPVSREMIFNFIAERVLGQPKSY